MRIYAFAGIGFGLIVAIIAFMSGGEKTARTVTLASTTSVDNSGFYDFILPKFRDETGIDVRVIAVGTGRALNIASKGDADLVLVHDKESEQEFVAAGNGVKHRSFMYNHYILVGDKNDPAGIAGGKDILLALRKIMQERRTFLSRGDASGTHKKELSLWQMLGIQVDPRKYSWYVENGNGMGATLNMANEMRAYTLSDTATWVTFKNRSNLRALVQDVPLLLNPYSVILTNPLKHANVRYVEAQAFADWLVEGNGSYLIEAFRLDGVQLFHYLQQQDS